MKLREAGVNEPEDRDEIVRFHYGMSSRLAALHLNLNLFKGDKPNYHSSAVPPAVVQALGQKAVEQLHHCRKVLLDKSGWTMDTGGTVGTWESVTAMQESWGAGHWMRRGW
jgi:hypothetical protein